MSNVKTTSQLYGMLFIGILLLPVDCHVGNYRKAGLTYIFSDNIKFYTIFMLTSEKTRNVSTQGVLFLKTLCFWEGLKASL